jgi:hypothetical protein
MALTKDTKARLVSALTRKSLADEFEALTITPGACSAKLKAAIRAMMCNKAAANEVIAALETAGNQVLSGPANPNAKRRLRDALCRTKAADEIDALI